MTHPGATHTSDAQRRTPRRPKLLVVDDTPQNIKVLEAVLAPRGYAVVAASSGAEGLRKVATEAPDLVLLDVVMPGMSGYEVCRQLRADPATAFLPVVMITASGDQERLQAVEAGADDFVQKPFNQAELLARISSLLRIKAYHDTVEAQAAELADWNRTLEARVQEQVSELERLGRLRFLITQNIDGLHLAAGSSPERTVELHGTAHRVYCMDCGAETPRDEITARLEAGEELPVCLVCGGTLRAATVGFGEPLPQTPWRLALDHARRSDLFLVIGSSLVVNPAAQLPLAAAAAGAYLAIVNQEPTPLDRHAHLLLRGSAGAIMARLIDEVRARL